MTPQKFDTLMRRFCALPINSEERLTGVIDLIFEKVCIFILKMFRNCMSTTNYSMCCNSWLGVRITNLYSSLGHCKNLTELKLISHQQSNFIYSHSTFQFSQDKYLTLKAQLVLIITAGRKCGRRLERQKIQLHIYSFVVDESRPQSMSQLLYNYQVVEG